MAYLSFSNISGVNLRLISFCFSLAAILFMFYLRWLVKRRRDLLLLRA